MGMLCGDHSPDNRVSEQSSFAALPVAESTGNSAHDLLGCLPMDLIHRTADAPRAICLNLDRQRYNGGRRNPCVSHSPLLRREHGAARVCDENLKVITRETGAGLISKSFIEKLIQGIYFTVISPPIQPCIVSRNPVVVLQEF